MSSLHQITLSTKRPGFQNWKTDYFYRDHRKDVKLNYKKCQLVKKYVTLPRPKPVISGSHFHYVSTLKEVSNEGSQYSFDGVPKPQNQSTYGICLRSHLTNAQEPKHLPQEPPPPMPRTDLLESTLPPLSSHSQVAPELERSQISLQWSLYPGMIREQAKG